MISKDLRNRISSLIVKEFDKLKPDWYSHVAIGPLIDQIEGLIEQEAAQDVVQFQRVASINIPASMPVEEVTQALETFEKQFSELEAKSGKLWKVNVNI